MDVTVAADVKAIPGQIHTAILPDGLPVVVVGVPDDDAATVNLGGKWRLPTQKEAQELISQCTYVEKNLNGVSGYEFTGKNGKTLFFPITCMMISA